MVEDAASQSEARATIVDVSRAVYSALEPSGASAYLGLAPRLAQHVFRVPDVQGRLALLGDPRTETAVVPSEIETTSDALTPVRLRSEAAADLVALQQAAQRAGAPFWVRSGFRQPTDAEASKAIPTEWILPCSIEQPARVPDRPVSDVEAAAAQSQQAWLGTTLSVGDRRTGPPSTADKASTSAGRWLASHAAEFGFVPALPETNIGRALGHEPWTLRWVGHEMAARLQPVVTEGIFAARATALFQQAETELANLDSHASQPPLWGVSDTCWAIATTSTRGCPSRWYFLGLPLS
jgi:hypothetical protein